MAERWLSAPSWTLLSSHVASMRSSGSSKRTSRTAPIPRRLSPHDDACGGAEGAHRSHRLPALWQTRLRPLEEPLRVDGRKVDASAAFRLSPAIVPVGAVQ